jgi:hypothetical protein
MDYRLDEMSTGEMLRKWELGEGLRGIDFDAVYVYRNNGCIKHNTRCILEHGYEYVRYVNSRCSN